MPHENACPKGVLQTVSPAENNIKDLQDFVSAQREQEMKEYLEQLAQEKGLSEIERTKEMQIAVRVAKGEVSAAEAKLAAARVAKAISLGLIAPSDVQFLPRQ